MFIDGRHHGGEAGPILESREPATGAVLDTVAAATPADVERACAAARAAFEDGPWPRLTAAERRWHLETMADALEDRQAELAELEARDTGMPLHYTAQGHLPRAIAAFRFFAVEGERLSGPTFLLEDHAQLTVAREPVGVAAVLAPWNSPLGVASLHVAAALACGNTCVLKPSELAPLSADALARAALAAELPPGVLNVLHGGPEVGAALVEHGAVDAVAFTGGTATGRAVLARAAPGLKRVCCELGGKSPTIVFADADREAALDGALLSAFGTNGEACMAGTRLLVEWPIFEGFVEAFAARARAMRIGDPLEPGTELGPLISRAHRARVLDAVDGARAAGARALAGGRIPPGRERGYFIEPTVLVDVPAEAPVAQQELFGPVVVAIPFATEEEAIALGNGTPYGLAAYVWSGDAPRALRVGRRLRAGTVCLGSPMLRDLRTPFGGYKQSGPGRLGGRWSLDFFTEVKTTCLPMRRLPLPRLGAGGRGEGDAGHSR